MVEADLRGWPPIMGVFLDDDLIELILVDAGDALSGYVSADRTMAFATSAHIVTARTWTRCHAAGGCDDDLRPRPNPLTASLRVVPELATPRLSGRRTLARSCRLGDGHEVSAGSHLPPPPPRPPPAGPGAVWSGAVVRVVAVAFATAAAGWGLLLFGLYAEADTGLPDGLACTGRLADSVDSYVDCMRREEGRAMIGWGLAAGLAAAGLVTLARSRGVSRSDLSQRVVTVLAGLAALSLAAAVLAVWFHGAGGGFYDDAFGPGRWNLTMGLGSTIGVVAGWVLSIGLKGSGTASAGSSSSGPR